MVEVGGEWEEVDGEEAGILLLIREMGGDVFASRGLLDDPDSTSVSIAYVAGKTSPKLGRLIGLLEELEGRGGRRRRRKT